VFEKFERFETIGTVLASGFNLFGSKGFFGIKKRFKLTRLQMLVVSANVAIRYLAPTIDTKVLEFAS
jgi:hypothetical protein